MKFTTSLKKLKANYNPAFTDGVATAPNALTSATAAFVAGDVGKQIVAATDKIKAGTTIASVTNGTTVVLVHGSGTAVMAGGPHSSLPFRIAGRARTTIDVPVTTFPAGTVVREVINNASAALSAQLTQTLADGVSLNADATYESELANFVAADVGKSITGTNIPADTTILSVTDDNTIEMSNPASAAGTGLTFNIVNRERLTAATMRLITPGHNYGTAKSALVANVPDADYVPFLESMTASKAAVMRVALTGANLSALTHGSIDTWINFGSLS